MLSGMAPFPIDPGLIRDALPQLPNLPAKVASALPSLDSLRAFADQAHERALSAQDSLRQTVKTAVQEAPSDGLATSIPKAADDLCATIQDQAKGVLDRARSTISNLSHRAPMQPTSLQQATASAVHEVWSESPATWLPQAADDLCTALQTRLDSARNRAQSLVDQARQRTTAWNAWAEHATTSLTQEACSPGSASSLHNAADELRSAILDRL